MMFSLILCEWIVVGLLQTLRAPQGSDIAGWPARTLRALGRSGIVFLPIAQLLFSLVFRDALAFLNLAQQLVFFAIDHIQIIIRELAPLLFDLAFDLGPIAFNDVFVHGDVLLRIDGTGDDLGLALADCL
jgi:hypothetical protein